MFYELIRNEVLPLGLLGGALLCFGVYWAVWAGGEAVSLTGAWVKACATGLVAVVLLEATIFDPGVSVTTPLALMPLGLLFGAVGDFALARRNERAFLVGMAAFAIGHLIYAFALWARTNDIVAMGFTHQSGPASGGLSFAQIAALVGLALLLLSTELWLAPKTAALRWPVRGYVLVIGAMAAVVIVLVDQSGTRALWLGAALFVASDLLLALRLFVVKTAPVKRALSLVLWPAYWLGQMLLMLGAMGYWTFPKG